jgi:hypothetical protein
MQKEEEIASSLTMTDPWSLFLYGMKSLMTREKYRGRLPCTMLPHKDDQSDMCPD